MRWPLGPIRQALTARVWLRHSLNVPIFLEVIHRMQRKKYERISRRITVLTLFHQMARLAGQIYFVSCDRAFHACFRRFSKDTVSPLSVNCSLLLSWSRAGNGHRFLNDFSTPDGTSTCRSRRTGWNVGLAGVRKVRMYMWTSLNVS